MKCINMYYLKFCDYKQLFKFKMERSQALKYGRRKRMHKQFLIVFLISVRWSSASKVNKKNIESFEIWKLNLISCWANVKSRAFLLINTIGTFWFHYTLVEYFWTLEWNQSLQKLIPKISETDTWNLNNSNQDILRNNN